jgi:hypothetical protein
LGAGTIQGLLTKIQAGRATWWNRGRENVGNIQENKAENKKERKFDFEMF